MIISSTPTHEFFIETKTGDVLYLNVLGRSLVILNSTQAAVNLLDKRSSNYSDRAYFPIYTTMGDTKGLVFMSYGKDFQFHRRMCQQHFSKNECLSCRPIQSREARVLVKNLISNPEPRCEQLPVTKFPPMLRFSLYLSTWYRFSTAVIMRITYRHQVMSNADPFLEMAQAVCYVSGTPGSTPVDFFPVCTAL